MKDEKIERIDVQTGDQVEVVSADPINGSMHSFHKSQVVTVLRPTYGGIIATDGKTESALFYDEIKLVNNI